MNKIRFWQSQNIWILRNACIRVQIQIVDKKMATDSNQVSKLDKRKDQLMETTKW